jgi:hypothetical protein
VPGLEGPREDLRKKERIQIKFGIKRHFVFRVLFVTRSGKCIGTGISQK